MKEVMTLAWLAACWVSAGALIAWQRRKPEFATPFGVLGMTMEFVFAPLWVPFVAVAVCFFSLIDVTFKTLDFICDEEVRK